MAWKMQAHRDSPGSCSNRGGLGHTTRRANPREEPIAGGGRLVYGFGALIERRLARVEDNGC
jgi:hypothetical protein